MMTRTQKDDLTMTTTRRYPEYERETFQTIEDVVEDGNPPYIRSIIRRTYEGLSYNPKYGDSIICICGHPYYRHFDAYDRMYPVGCKYCDCSFFIRPD
jgi:hypothetical protein